MHLCLGTQRIILYYNPQIKGQFNIGYSTTHRGTIYLYMRDITYKVKGSRVY